MVIKDLKDHFPDELIGDGTGHINPNSKDFQLLREAIKKRASQISNDQKRKVFIQGVIYRMESFLYENMNESTVLVGKCLKELVEIIQIPHKDFAKFIGLQHSILNKIYEGKYRINQDLALKFGQIFSMNPSLWLQVQSKAELELFRAEAIEKYEDYSLENLMEQYG
ncbi:MAG: hypothetical protein AAF694_10180 [Bacteroidota bacterium]